MREAAIPRHIAGCANPDACRFRRRLLIDVHDQKHHPPRVTVRLSAAKRSAQWSVSWPTITLGESSTQRILYHVRPEPDKDVGGARHALEGRGVSDS